MIDWLPPSLQESSHPRVLVVEDDPFCMRLLVDALEFEGYEVFALHTDQGAHELAKRCLPGVLLCDLMLHGEPRGLALIEQFLSDPLTSHIPIILCSVALELIHHEFPYLQHQQISLLHKPFELNVLSATVAAALHSPRLRAREHGS